LQANLDINAFGAPETLTMTKVRRPPRESPLVAATERPSIGKLHRNVTVSPIFSAPAGAA